jgi:hypothetical protein
MDIIGTVKHIVAGHEYEIVNLWTGSEWQVIIHDEKKRRIGPVFSVSLEVAQDYQHYNKQPALDALIEIAQADLDSGRVKSTTSTDPA